MVGITFTPEQIRAAPLEVRRWIERELTASLGLQPGIAPAEQPRREHLVACTYEEAAGVLSLIQGMFPVVNVFFELGRQGASLGSDGLESFRLADILQHTRLPNVSQVIACLDIINEALRRIRTDATATLYVLDKRGNCIVAAETLQNILRLWHQVIGRPERAVAETAPRAGTDGEASEQPAYGEPKPDSGAAGLKEDTVGDGGI